MSVNDLITMVAEQRLLLLVYFFGVPALSFLASLAAKPYAKQSPALSYVLSTCIYLAAVPGMFSSTLLFYSLFMLRTNILDVDALIYFLPIISMGLVFFTIRRKVDFEQLPGFDRLSGLMMMLFLVCLVVLCLYRFRFVIGFFSSIGSLVAIGVVLFFVFKLAAKKAFTNDKKARESKFFDGF